MKLHLLFEAIRSMDDDGVWESLGDYFQSWEIWEIRQALKTAQELGAWGEDIIPPPFLPQDSCSIACTFYSKEVAEVWWSKVGRPHGGGKYIGSNPKPGYRTWVTFYPNKDFS